MVRLAKLGSWHLRLYLAFVTVTLVTRRALHVLPLVPGAGREHLAKS